MSFFHNFAEQYYDIKSSYRRISATFSESGYPDSGSCLFFDSGWSQRPASGAGMGCPDWPTCFGQWVPPTHESQPADYQQTYAELGYADTRFNVVKTWTEYLNRLLGVSIGILIFLSALVSWPLRHHNALLTKASVAAFFMVGFQGWLGSRVVSSNLQPGMITLHMLMALAIVATLLFALAQSRRQMMAHNR